MAPKTARNVTQKAAKNVAKKAVKKLPSIGPVWRAIEAFEKKVRGMEKQPKAYSVALKQLEKAKKHIPDCKENTGEFEFLLMRPKKG